MKITFAGYYGFKNYGDDLFVAACAYASKKFWSQHRCSILSPNISDINTNYIIPSFFKNTYCRATIDGKILRFTTAIYATLNNNILIFAGGSTLSSGGTTSIKKMQFLFSKYNIGSFAGVGVSIGPFNSIENEKNYE